ncbi:MAG: CBS domain-containing protein [Sphaerochaetaceae bacterium]
MSEVPVITYVWEGPKTALTLMRREKKKIGYVVDQKQRFLGVITAKELERLLSGEERFKTIPTSSIEVVDTVTEDVLIEDLFSIAPKNPYPIPVVDEKNKLLGRITNDHIFESISNNEGGSDV